MNPCPFCHSTNTKTYGDSIDEHTYVAYVVCKKCGIQGPISLNKRLVEAKRVAEGYWNENHALEVDMIQEFIKSQMTARKFLEMAIDRSEYKNSIQKKTPRVVRHYYKIALANKIGRISETTIAHWERELRAFTLDLFDVADGETSGRWNRKTALREAFDFIKSRDLKYRKDATKDISDIYKKKLPAELDDRDTELFWKYIDGYINDMDNK